MFVIFLCIVSFNSNLHDTVLIQPNYLVNGISGVVGGIVGFGVVSYATAFAIGATGVGGINFPNEMGYMMGFALGIPIYASSFIHFNPLNKCRSREAFNSSIKYSLIGVQLGLGCLIIGTNISGSAKYLTGAFIAILPIAGAIMGYHAPPLKIETDTGAEKGSMINIDATGNRMSIKFIELRLQ